MSASDLQQYISKLQKKLEALRSQPKTKRSLRYVILYRTLQLTSTTGEKDKSTCTRALSCPYFDQPVWRAKTGRGDTVSGAYHCSEPVENFELYCERNKDVPFIVYRTYVGPLGKDGDIEGSRLTLRNSTIPDVQESIYITQPQLITALEQVLERHDEYVATLQQFRTTGELKSPYSFCYYYGSDFAEIISSTECTAAMKTQVELFLTYIKQRLGPVYEDSTDLMSQGLTSNEYLDFVFKPGDTMVHYHEDGHYTAFVATTWTKREWTRLMSRQDAENLVRKQASPDETAEAGKPRMLRKDEVRVSCWALSGWSWAYNVTFFRQTQVFKFHTLQEIDVESNKDLSKVNKLDHMMPIDRLTILPLRLCAPNVADVLRRRGHTFWRCRYRRLVSYIENETDSASDGERYMVDVGTYHRLHSSAHRKDDLGKAAMERETCPIDDFALLVPLRIRGFNLRKKKWHDLLVDRISEVTWKKEAFKEIVMDPRAKEIVRALISKQISSERSTDLITSKGNGLILLLHGPPGTGKTLTAESVAEIAEKPLYRVTCGDVGTKAEDVEKYLDSVFSLGKLWGCVVLVDEADVFLEQRDLQDLNRNALVSVFLRVLEYYEGILVLTSNRVGTFDDAFKSRIQLALHYPKLNQNQRCRIWENFINRLESFNDPKSINIQDLRVHLDELSQHEMNGREIRNALTTARQYADYLNATMTYQHVKDAIEIAGRFDKYLDDLHEGVSQEQIHRDGRVR